MTGLLIGVFVGAMAYEVLRKTEIAQKTARKVSGGVRSAKRAFSEGYRSTAQLSAASD